MRPRTFRRLCRLALALGGGIALVVRADDCAEGIGCVVGWFVLSMGCRLVVRTEVTAVVLLIAALSCEHYLVVGERLFLCGGTIETETPLELELAWRSVVRTELPTLEESEGLKLTRSWVERLSSARLSFTEPHEKGAGIEIHLFYRSWSWNVQAGTECFDALTLVFALRCLAATAPEAKVFLLSLRTRFPQYWRISGIEDEVPR